MAANAGWRLLAWLQPILIAALTGGMIFVQGNGRRAVESTSDEWAGVYTRSVREFMRTELELEQCESELQAFSSSVPSG